MGIQDAVGSDCGMSANDCTIHDHAALDVGEAHHHAISNLYVPFDHAGVADVGILYCRSALNAAIPSDGYIAF
jgi:hypothetical protein